MRAWQVEAFGPYKEALSIAEVPEPDLSSDGVIIDVRASGVMWCQEPGRDSRAQSA
jgi:NADPH:quinone reductase-like Zn-dependent oxidoreductase